MKVTDLLREKEAFVSLQGASKEDINAAEVSLNVKFTNEYVEYAAVFGAASYYGHELTGVCKAQAINVVDVTEKERAFTKNVPQDWYVIEQTHMDGIVYWQSKNGEIYMTAPKQDPVFVCESLEAYVEGKI